MTGATLILIVNLCVGALFSAVFLAIASYGKPYRSAVWWVGVYAFCVIAYVTEVLLSMDFANRLFYELGFMAYLAGFYSVAIGLYKRYGVTPPWLLLGTLFVIFSIINASTYGLPRDNLVHQFSYQWPLATAYMFCFYCAWRFGHGRLEKVILGISAFGVIYFLSKPWFAIGLNAGVSDSDYLSTAYAAWSQTSAAILLVGQGVAFIFIYMMDIIEDLKAVSFTDGLSGLLNRRGFSARVAALMSRLTPGTPCVVMIADLDHFKMVNDTYGHSVGDEVIEGFSQLLRDTASADHVVGRAGGEEFVMFLSHANEPSGRLLAESMRTQFARTQFRGLPEGVFVTASYGVAEFGPGEGLGDAIDRADMALYAAKRDGRNRVKVASQIATQLSPRDRVRLLSSEGHA